ncbi:MAG TPA: hypothetical protein VFS25_09450 [Chitinophaga sp.]|uniref:hypothetical protein n=1 Tax=Chitinophaga sp. TaxID=1869181 RepID=UPI002DB6A751|nr:hypothetical protein [Chitinophaga sp.]HEU4553049.1 hypothetical protein [Chitinophaga sp.]
MLSGSSLYQRRNIFTAIECLLIIGLALVPLFSTFPYRVNIFLSWEGAYRLSTGQMPYRDFGTPLGYGFWIIPSLFFRLFGPQLISLVKAQVLINIMSGFAFRSILKRLNVAPGIRALSVMVFVLSYSFFNFWPWYNHTVIVFELVGLAFLFQYMTRPQQRVRFLYLVLAALFTFLSIFTKQDGGGLALLLCLALLLYNSLHEKTWWDIPAFLGCYLLVAIIIIAPLLPYGFGYWYNHGQPPHNSRLSVNDFAEEILGASQWIKFYLVLIVLCLVPAFRNFKAFWENKPAMLFTLLTLGILAEAALFQVTSYTPPDNNIFFHSFAFAFLCAQFASLQHIDFGRRTAFLSGALLVLLWWSGTFWKYIDRIFQRVFPAPVEMAQADPNAENVVSRRNFMLNTDTTKDVPTSEWIFSSLPEFKKIYMPPSTVHGMERVLNLPVVKEKKDSIKVLNMTELTPLAHAMPFKLETGEDYPLWYHLGVGMFNRQLAAFKQKVQQHHYDLVLYEYAPGLNNFFPFALRTELKKHYRQVDEFLAPRRPTNAIIEVYVKP